MSLPNCSCGACCEPCGHEPGCVRYEAAPAVDTAAEVAAEDGFPLLRAAIRHPSHAATRRHFTHQPLPTQQNRRAS